MELAQESAISQCGSSRAARMPGFRTVTLHCCSLCLTETKAGYKRNSLYSNCSSCCCRRSCSAGNYRPSVCQGILQSSCARRQSQACITGISLHLNRDLNQSVKDFIIIPCIIPSTLKWVRYCKGSQHWLHSINFCYYVHCLVRPVSEMCHYTTHSLQQPQHISCQALHAEHSQPACTNQSQQGSDKEWGCGMGTPAGVLSAESGCWWIEQGSDSATESHFLPACENVWKYFRLFWFWNCWAVYAVIF